MIMNGGVCVWPSPAITMHAAHVALAAVGLSLYHGRGSETLQRLPSSSGAEVGRTQIKYLSLIHISEPTRQEAISYAVFCLKKKK